MVNLLVARQGKGYWEKHKLCYYRNKKQEVGFLPRKMNTFLRKYTLVAVQSNSARQIEFAGKIGKIRAIIAKITTFDYIETSEYVKSGKNEVMYGFLLL